MADSLLWRIEPAGGGPVSYLFGTIHVGHPRVLPPVRAALVYLAECRMCALEMDLSEGDASTSRDYILPPPPLVLDQALSRSGWKNLSKYGPRLLGAPVGILRFQQPMLLAEMLGQDAQVLDSESIPDRLVWQEAERLGLPVCGLETLAEQIDLFGKIPFEDQIAALESALKNISRRRRHFRSLMEDYAQGRLKNLCKKARKQNGLFKRLLIDRRNETMTARLKPLILSQSVFCAVGAGHLAGAKGMLRLLKRQEFHVSPVPIHG